MTNPFSNLDLATNIKDEIGSSKSRKAYHLMSNALSGELTLGIVTSEIDLRVFAWSARTEDRNWWWQLQALPFLNWFISSYDLLDDEEKSSGLSYCSTSLSQWINCASNNKKSPLSWHDHATAFRLRNIVRWISFLLLRDLGEKALDDCFSNLLFKTLKRHTAFLLKEGNYSKHTNHGFDQSLVLYNTHLMWPKFDLFSNSGKIGQERLKDEMYFAFTDEYVHKENSPGYQDYMLDRLDLVSRLSVLGDTNLTEKAENIKKGAAEFLSIITQPDGFLPAIGDTRALTKGKESSLSSTMAIYDYSNSGYVIAKGLTKKKKNIFLVFKCCHLSNYHRHDDDLSIYLFYDGEVILGDGGLGSYHEKDPQRIFLRSGPAHNTVYPLGLRAIRNPDDLEQAPGLELNSGIVSGETSCYGGRLKRSLNLNLIADGIIDIRDEWVKAPNSNEQEINFYFTQTLSVKHHSDSFSVQTKKGNSISFQSSIERSFFYIENDWDKSTNKGAIHSPGYGKYSTATRAGWRLPLSEKNPITTSILLDSDLGIDGEISVSDKLNTPVRLKNIQLDRIFTGKGFSTKVSDSQDTISIESLGKGRVYICLGEPHTSFTVTTESAHPVIGTRTYSFRFLGCSNSDSLLYIIGYDKSGNRDFTERVSSGSLKNITLADNIVSFRLFIRLADNDSLDFYNIIWNNSDTSGSIIP